MGWLLWVIGIAIAVIVGLNVFGYYQVPYVIDQIRAIGGVEASAKALFVALGLVALAKVVG